MCLKLSLESSALKIHRYLEFDLRYGNVQLFFAAAARAST